MIVGITGHRPNRLHIGEPRVRVRLSHVLHRLKRASRLVGARRARFVAVSALAEGADRLFAAAALDLGFDLQALLPFGRADYETTFGDATTTAEFRALLARAAVVRELPGRLDEDTAAYEAVGRALVEKSDVLVAVWDGRPAAGRGGTPEVIQYALDRGMSVIWIDAAQDRPPRLLQVPMAGGPRAVALATLAARARSP